MPAKVVVLGNINQDFVMSAERMPRPGETILGSDLHLVAGGKAANQAVTAARLGAEVTLIGRVGNDVFGPVLMDNFKREKIFTEHIKTDETKATGAAFITLAPSGENSIISVPGANFQVTPAQIRDASDAIAAADVALVQFATSMHAIEELINICSENDTLVQIDPTPIRDRLPRNFSSAFSTVPNETEVEAITGITVTNLEKAVEAASALRKMGLTLAIVKLGANGCVLQTSQGSWHIPGFSIEVADTTGAGDSFAAGFAMAMTEDNDPVAAAIFANACGAFAATKFGAQPSLPTRGEVDAFLKEHSTPGIVSL